MKESVSIKEIYYFLERGFSDLFFSAKVKIKGTFMVWKGSETINIGDNYAEFEVKDLKTAKLLIFFQDNETKVLRYLMDLDSENIFYDIGSNIGFYSILMSKTVGEENVVAFEPHEPNISQLRRNMKLNGLDFKVEEIALYNEKGSYASNGLSEEISGSIGINPESLKGDFKAVVGDEYVAENNLKPPSVVKIDVEGAEMNVLEGMENTIQSNCEIIVVETHLDSDLRLSIEDYGYEYKDIEEKLRELGFETRLLDERRDEIVILGEKL